MRCAERPCIPTCWNTQFGWTNLETLKTIPNRVKPNGSGLNVGTVLANKRAAIAAHETQTTDLIADDPDGFRLTPQTIARLTQSTEVFWRPINETD
jgi:hypothetical protein